VVVDDRGHTGAGGNKSDALEINVALHAGAANTAPRLTMWPENRGARVLPQSLGAAAAREAPLGVEFALHGLYLEDEDSLDGLMQVAARTCPCAPMQGRLLQLQQPRCTVASRSVLLHCCGVPETAAAECFHVALSQVTVTATHGLLSLHGLGPWSAGGAGRAVFEETVQRRADGSVFEVWGRQVATTRVRGYTQRSVLCTTVGGFSDEYLVEGPVAGQLRVRRNSGPAEYPAGASTPLREVLLHAGHALPLHYDAEADFALQLFVSASADVNVLLLDEDNYELYSQARPFAFVPGPSFLGARNASVARFEVAVPRPTRWFLVVEEARGVDLPGWAETLGAAEWAQGEPARDVRLEYAVAFERLVYPLEHFAAATGLEALQDPTADAVCQWLHADRDARPPPGLRQMDLSFEEGDGHRDASMVCPRALSTS
jgi:hypothetical protein